MKGVGRREGVRASLRTVETPRRLCGGRLEFLSSDS